MVYLLHTEKCEWTSSLSNGGLIRQGGLERVLLGDESIRPRQERRFFTTWWISKTVPDFILNRDRSHPVLRSDQSLNKNLSRCPKKLEHDRGIAEHSSVLAIGQSLCEGIQDQQDLITTLSGIRDLAPVIQEPFSTKCFLIPRWGLIAGCLALLSLTRPVFAEGGGSHHRIRVTPDYDNPGFSMASELNIYRGALYTNIMSDYLTEDGWDIGINAFNIPISGASSANGRQYDTYINLTKFFYPTEYLIFGVGTQNGTNFSGGGRQLHNFDYAQMTYEWGEWAKLTAGTYYVNDSLSQSHQNVGALVGIDIMFEPGLFWTEMDWFSGDNNLSGAVVNNFWQATEIVALYAGVQVPAAQSGNTFAGILGVALNLE